MKLNKTLNLVKIQSKRMKVRMKSKLKSNKG